MVSSAVYRYFPSRDELLTALIVDAYDAVGAAAEQAEAAVRRGRLRRALAGRRARAARAWAVANPQEYALIFGSPVPGYRAPTAHDRPGGADSAAAAGDPRRRRARPARSAPTAGRAMPRSVRADLKALRDAVAPGAVRAAAGPGAHGVDAADRQHQLRTVRPPAQRHPRLRGLLRLPDARRRPRPGLAELAWTDVVTRLRAAGCVFAEDEAGLLIEAAASPAELEALVARRVGGEPLEYILGWVSFRGRRIAVTPGVFVPRRRTEFWSRRRAAPRPGAVVVDLCCGCGAIGAARVPPSVGPASNCTRATSTRSRCACARRNLPRRHGRCQGDLFDRCRRRCAGGSTWWSANVPTSRPTPSP